MIWCKLCLNTYSEQLIFMSKGNKRISTLAVIHVNTLYHRMAVCQSLNRYTLKWIKSFLLPIFGTVKVQVVRNYMKFITCQKTWSWQFSMQFCYRMIATYQISKHLARNVSRQFSAQNCFSWWKTRFNTYSVHFGGMSSAYMFWVNYQHNRYMSSFRKLLINSAQVINLDHFLRYTAFRLLIHEFLQLAQFTLGNRR